jgi:YidC/Oxa1 family membrane protein insertase
MGNIWNLILFQPLLNALIFFYQNLFSNLGLAIIALTVVIRLILTPLTLPSIKAASKMKELAPELEKLKIKFKNDKQKFAQAQLALYKQHGANPASGCLPQIVQLIILIALYNAFIRVLNNQATPGTLNSLLYSFNQLKQDVAINTNFLYLNLSKPDVFHFGGLPFPLPGLFLILAAAVQFLASKMSMPIATASKVQAEKTPGKSDDMAAAMQSQMLYLFPLMTILIGFTLPSGLALYWFIFSLFTVIQQYYINSQSKLNHEKK